MKISLNWLNDYVSLDDISHDELQRRITIQSQEVDSLIPLTEAKNLVVGETITCEGHPDADKLSLCSVNVGSETLQIICGAPNVKAHQKVIVALPGAILPNDFKIKKTQIRGVESNGMICSLKELGIEEKYHHEDGIHVLPNDVEVGADALEVLGFDDYVLDLDLTPNRPDLLSMHGMAYDIKALFDVPVHLPSPKVKTSEKTNPFTIKTSTDKCLSYYGAVIDDIKIKESPLWLKARLIASGIRPINNVVDITNYVMLETNQPLHAFDYAKVKSDTILVREAKEGETFTTLDEQKRFLKAGDILITNGHEPIALGGVMGGLDSEVSETTTTILLESAIFDTTQIRKTSQRLDLKSESSIRFERGLDYKKTAYALKRAGELLAKYANATIRRNTAYFDNHDTQTDVIDLSLKKVNRVLGTELSAKTIQDILRRLDFTYQFKDDIFAIEKPSRRVDIKTYQDLIEEIGRIYDYNNLKDTLPVTISKGGLSDYQRFKRQLRHSLTGLGLSETITYTLMNDHQLFDLMPYKELKPVKLANPISEEHSSLILTPLNNLLKMTAYNVARRSENVHAFEISKTYQLNYETEVLGIVMQGPYQNRYWQATSPTNFFTLKGVIEALFDRFQLSGIRYEKGEIDNFHPHQTAWIKHNDTTLGYLGKLHPAYASLHDLESVYMAHLDIEKIYDLMTKTIAYEKVLKYPSVSRDIALICDEAIPAGTIIRSIHENSTSILRTAHIFDVYRGDNIETDKKSLAIRLHFEDKTGTLKTKTVDEMVKNILEALKQEHNAVLR